MRRADTRSVALLFVVFAVAAGCAGASGPGAAPARSKDPASVVNRTWQWQGTVTPVEKIAAAEPERYTIVLTGDGKVQARFDCNRGGGDYRMSEGKLTFGPLLSTRMACPPDSQDAIFMRDLQRVESFFVDNGNLYLGLPLDSGTMHFRPTD